jgi:hypothetical protein
MNTIKAGCEADDYQLIGEFVAPFCLWYASSLYHHGQASWRTVSADLDISQKLVHQSLLVYCYILRDKTREKVTGDRLYFCSGAVLLSATVHLRAVMLS